MSLSRPGAGSNNPFAIEPLPRTRPRQREPDTRPRRSLDARSGPIDPSYSGGGGLACASVSLCPPSLAAESDGVLVFGSADPDDAPSEAGRGVRLDERVRRCRIDPPHDGIHGDSGVPLIDV